VYAVAQGMILVPADRNATKTLGTVSNGAIAERSVISTFITNNLISLNLRNPDFVTAQAVKDAISLKYPDLTINVRDSALVEISIPKERQNDVVKFVSELETVVVKPDPSSKVVIDSKSGVIIMGEQVKIGKVAVSWKAGSITVGTSFGGASGDKKEQFVLQDTVTIADFVSAMKDIGLNTDTIIAILKAIEDAGSLYGTLIVN
jgi:flagellar P-ring protein precursor FlgI